MIKEYFKSWTKFEITLVLVTITVIILSGIVFNSSIITMIFSIASIITAMLQAKGKVESQFTSIVVCVLYSIISYKNRYFGEVIFYLLIMLPMAIAGVISWMTHKSNKTNTVEVNEIKLKEWMFLVLICIVAFIGLYNLLEYFNTSQLLVSTISMIVSLLAIYLLVRRSKYSFIFYILNDIILIILWGLPILAGDLLLIPMLIDPLALLVNDTYGAINWNKMEEKQNN